MLTSEGALPELTSCLQEVARQSSRFALTKNSGHKHAMTREQYHCNDRTVSGIKELTLVVVNSVSLVYAHCLSFSGPTLARDLSREVQYVISVSCK